MEVFDVDSAGSLQLLLDCFAGSKHSETDVPAGTVGSDWCSHCSLLLRLD